MKMPSFVPECNNRCTDKGQLTQTKKKKKKKADMLDAYSK